MLKMSQDWLRILRDVKDVTGLAKDTKDVTGLAKDVKDVKDVTELRKLSQDWQKMLIDT